MLLRFIAISYVWYNFDRYYKVESKEMADDYYNNLQTLILFVPGIHYNVIVGLMSSHLNRPGFVWGQ